MTDYDFDPFFDALGDDWYADDDLLLRLLARRSSAGKGPGETSAGASTLGEWGRACAGPLRELAEESALPWNRPRLRHFDARERRVDEVLLPRSTREALAVVEGHEGLGAPHGDLFDFYARIYLYAQNGEAGVCCSAACTDGLVRALEALGDRPEHREAVERVRGSTEARVWHGAQFVTEIQGGSDIPANRTRAVPDGDGYRLHGKKWFCSNPSADYYLVMARAEGEAGGEGGGSGAGAGRRAEAAATDADDRPLGLFLVPARLDPDRPGRNGHRLDRLKDKLGTRELATAEITFDGALGWPVGPLERGLPNLLRHVLVTSRFSCVLFAAAALRRTERIVRAYADFRTAFGRRLSDYPLVRERLDGVERGRARALASAFRLLASWQRAGEGDEAEKLAFRVMLSLAKTVHTREATRLVHDAMMALGGNGIEERFSPLPRLHRDSVIMETWEGPHDVLLTQALRDLRRFGADAGEFVERVSGEERDELARELDAVLDPDVELPRAAGAFRPVAERLVAAWADRELGAV